MKKYKLGELMEVTRGMSLSGEYYSTKGELMRLTLGNFDYHKNCFKEDKSKENLYFTGEVKEGFILNKDDIVTPLTEQAIGLLGSTAKIPCSGKYIQSQDVGLIKCNDKLNPNYAFYLIPSKLVRKQLSVAAQQTKIRHTSPDKIKGCTVWIPEYDKQEKIGKLLSSLDDKIALNNRINAKLEQMAKRLYDYWFVQFDFPNADGKPYKSNGGKMVWNEELKREIPEGWEVVKIGNLLREEPKSRIQVNEALKMKGTIPFFTSGEDIHLVNDYLTNGSRIFMSTGGNANIKFFDGKTSYSTDTWCLSCDTYIHYCYLFMKTIINYINENLFAGSGLKHLQKEKTKEIYILKPPIDLINKFNALVTISFKKISDSKLENQKIESLRNKLLPLLMNGQVVVE